MSQVLGRCRIFQTGDLHIVEGARFDECQRVLSDLATLVERERPDAVLVGGDVYHKASTPTERLFAASIVQRWADVCPVVLLRGNHDPSRDLLLLGSLQARYPIHVVETFEVVHVAGVAVACLAWPELLSNGDVDASREAVAAVLRELGAQLRDHCGPRVLLTHCMPDGSSTGPGQPLVGGGLGVSLEMLALAGADIVLMSHVHRHQVWKLSTCQADAVMAGSPFRTDFGEMEAKVIVDVRFNLSEGSCTWSAIPTTARPMLHVEWPWDAERSELMIAPISDSYENADVRIRYHAPPEYMAETKRLIAEVKAALLATGAADVKTEPVPMVTTRSRSVEIAKAKKLSDKVQALWEARHTVPEAARGERLLGKLATLEARHGR